MSRVYITLWQSAKYLHFKTCVIYFIQSNHIYHPIDSICLFSTSQSTPVYPKCACCSSRIPTSRRAETTSLSRVSLKIQLCGTTSENLRTPKTDTKSANKKTQPRVVQLFFETRNINRTTKWMNLGGPDPYKTPRKRSIRAKSSCLKIASHVCFEHWIIGILSFQLVVSSGNKVLLLQTLYKTYNYRSY